MTIRTLKNYVNDNFTPMAWDRIELKLITDLSGHDQAQSLGKDLFDKIHRTLENMYGMGLSNELLNG